MSQAPGHYHAEGDPPGTVRWWDGTQWVGDPTPPPPPAAPPPPPPPGAGAGGAATSGIRFADLGVRFGAAAIDIVIVIAISFVLLLAFFGNSTDDGFEAYAGGAESVLLSALITAAYIGIIVAKAATPGKLMVGLRITEADGETNVTPRGAVMRSLPYIVGLIPVLGGLIVLGCGIAAMVMIGSDSAERRSVYDRIGNTRVVRK